MITNYNRFPELKVIYKPITERQYVRAMNLGDYKTDTFAIRFNPKNPNELFIPVLAGNDKMLLNYFSYKNEKGKKFSFAGGYRNVVMASEVYRKGHLRKIDRIFGVEILNPTEEKYPKLLEIFRQEVYVRFSATEWAWKLSHDSMPITPAPAEPEPPKAKKERPGTALEQWLQDEDMLDALQQTDAIDDINEAFETVTQIALETAIGERYAVCLARCSEAITRTERYFQVQADFDQITKKHHEYIQKLIHACREKEADVREYLELPTEYVKRLKDQDAMNDTEKKPYTLGDDKFDALRKYIRRLISQPGYWVELETGEIYENAAEHYALKQLAADNRNLDTKRKLKAALLETLPKLLQMNPNRNDKNFILLSNVELQNKLK